MQIFLHMFASLSPFLRDLAALIIALWVFFVVKMMWQAYRVQKANKAILSILLSAPEASGRQYKNRTTTRSDGGTQWKGH